MPDQRPANRLLATLPITPAVVLFRFDPRVESFHDDPVYNDGVAFPDDAPVIRARDLGPEKNRDIIHYHAQHQPDRVFYIYDPDAAPPAKSPQPAPRHGCRSGCHGNNPLSLHASATRLTAIVYAAVR